MRLHVYSGGCVKYVIRITVAGDELHIHKSVRFLRRTLLELGDQALTVMRGQGALTATVKAAA